MSLTMFAKEFLAMHFAFNEFGHILWRAKKPIIVMTDKKALTRFFQAKHIRLHFGIFVIKPSVKFLISTCTRS